MVGILQIKISNAFWGKFVREICNILIQTSLKLVTSGPMYYSSAIARVMVWHRAGDKPLSEPMTIHFTDAYTRH